MNTDNELTQIYYTIGQVSRMLNLPASLLRFWEKEFTSIKPRKTEGGTRKYSKADVELIKTIKQLVKIEGYTLEGAKEKIKALKQNTSKTNIIEELNDIKSFLITLKQLLNK